MNFLMIAFDFPPTIGGVETRIKNYIKNLTKMKHQVKTVALTLTNKKIYLERYLDTEVYRCPHHPKSAFKVLLTILNATKHYQAQAIHVLTGATSLAGLLFLLHGKISGKRAGIFLYGKDILTAKNQPTRLLLLNTALLITDKIGVNSKATSQLLPKLTLHKTHILYPGVDIQETSRYKTPRKAKEKKRILFTGRLIRRKGADDLLKAFKQVLETLPEARLTVVGDGPEKNTLQNLAKKLGVQEKVEFTGTLVGRKLHEKYQECDVFVMPSKKVNGDVEGFGMVFLEAASFKKPSIGTIHGGIPEAVLHQKTGILVPEADVTALKNAIELLLTKHELAERLGKSAYNRAIKEFTWEKATQRLTEMYKDRK